MRFQMSPNSEAFSNVSVFEIEGLRFRSLQCGREVKTHRKRCVFKWKRISVVQALDNFMNFPLIYRFVGEIHAENWKHCSRWAVTLNEQELQWKIIPLQYLEKVGETNISLYVRHQKIGLGLESSTSSVQRDPECMVRIKTNQKK